MEQETPDGTSGPESIADSKEHRYGKPRVGGATSSNVPPKTTKPKPVKSKPRKHPVSLHNIFTSLSLSQGLRPSKLAKMLGMSRQSLNFRLKDAEKRGFVVAQRLPHGTFLRLTDMGLEFCRSCKDDIDTIKAKTVLIPVDSHNYNFSIPILRMNAESSNFKQAWKAQIEGKNTEAFVLKEFIPGATLEIKGRKTLCVNLHKFKLPRDNTFHSALMLYVAKMLLEIKENLWKIFRIELDINRTEGMSQHFHNSMPELDGKVDFQKTLTVGFDRPAISLFGPMKEEAKAWIDSTPEKGIETNDLPYELQLLAMPVKIYELSKLAPFIVKQQADFAENLKTHKRVLEGIESASIRQAESAEKLQKILEAIEKKIR